MTQETVSPPQPLTHRRVLKIALPIVLSNATVPLMGAIDIGIIGQLGEAAPMGAVAMGAVILTSVYWIFGFLRMGTVGLVGQAAGAGDADEVSAWLTRALLVALAGGFLLIVLQWPIFLAAFALSPASAEVESLTQTYLVIRIWTAPAAIAVYALTGWLVAMERTGAVFWTQFIMNGLNIVLGFIFVLGLEWGVAGVALSTALSEVVGAAMGLWLCRGAFSRPAWRDRARVFERSKLIKMALLNVDILLRSAMLLIIMSSFVFLGAGFGDVTLAANEVLIQFSYITAYAMDGFAFAAETLVARAYGRKDPGRVRKASTLTSIWGLATCIGFSVFFWVAGPWLIDVMAKEPDVQVEARSYLAWMVAAPIVGCAAWMLDGIFIGAARGRDMRNMMTISFVIYWVAVFVLLPSMVNHGLWAALLISFAARGITLGIRYPALLHDARTLRR